MWWCCVSFLIYFVLFDSVVFALVFPFRCSLLLEHSPLDFFFIIISRLTPFPLLSTTDATHIGTYAHVYAHKYTVIRSPSWSINWWYCGNIEMSVFISLLFFISIFTGVSHPRCRSLDIIVTLRYAFFILDDLFEKCLLSGSFECQKNCTHVPNGTSCEHVCTENYFCQPFFVICHSSNPKKKWLLEFAAMLTART